MPRIHSSHICTVRTFCTSITEVPIPAGIGPFRIPAGIETVRIPAGIGKVALGKRELKPDSPIPHMRALCVHPAPPPPTSQFQLELELSEFQLELGLSEFQLELGERQLGSGNSKPTQMGERLGFIHPTYSLCIHSAPPSLKSQFQLELGLTEFQLELGLSEFQPERGPSEFQLELA